MLILFICFLAVNRVLERKYSKEKYADFFNQKEDFDVLIFGNSHALNAISPMQLWNDYGIISYNMANHAERTATTYYNILLACEKNTPQLVVVDTFMVKSQEKVSENLVHNMFDTYPISYKKYLAVKDLFDSKDLQNNEIEHLFNFSIYHARWNELIKSDFKIGKKYEKGAESRIEVAKPNNVIDFNSASVYNKEESINMQYLRKIIEYCKENNIQILVTDLPYPANKTEQISESKYVQTICNEYNVNYINFLGMNLVNYNTDCADSDSHLNPSGARKVTDYLGKYIMDIYNIPDQRNNNAYKFWYEDYNEYIDFKINNLKGSEKYLNNYLMLLYGEEDIKYEITISGKRKIEEGSTLKYLLENLNNNYKINDDAFKEKTDKTIKITTYDNRDGKLINTVWF